MTEEWRPVVGYEHFYDVSSLGRVRSVARLVFTNNGRAWANPGRILSPSGDWDGYKTIDLSAGGARKKKKVAVLVLESFIGPRPDGYLVCHGPSGMFDDSLKNVSWGTWSKNMGEDKIRDGSDNRGSKNGMAKLGSMDVQFIRHWIKSGYECSEIAPKFNVSRQAISDIKFGRRWAWL